MEILTRPPTAKGPAATFTGDVWVDGLSAGRTREQARPSVVRFAPSARSHRHPLTSTADLLGGLTHEHHF